MRALAWYELADDERRISVAQGFVWLSCVGLLIWLAVGIALVASGHTEVMANLAAHPVLAARGLLLLVLYICAAHLIGERRAAGGLLGLALYAYSLVSHLVHGRFVAWGVLWALAGIVLILRARHALKLPFVAPAS